MTINKMYGVNESDTVRFTNLTKTYARNVNSTKADEGSVDIKFIFY